MVLAGCWPNNALGEAKLAYCFSAGHLLDSAFVLQLQPRYLLGIEAPFYTCMHNNVPGISHSSSVNAQKHGVYFRKSANPCGALLGRNESFSAYPLMTLPVRRAVIRPSFASIADTLREESANKGLRLYENIYIDIIYIVVT